MGGSVGGVVVRGGEGNGEEGGGGKGESGLTRWRCRSSGLGC